MQSLLSRYVLLARHWGWLIILGMVLCAGTTFLISKRIHPVYQASAILIVNITSSSSAFDNVSAGELIAPTYAQLLTSQQVLQPVVAQHPGMSLSQLKALVTAKPQPNTTLIELDVENSNPDLAMNLANEISQSFAYYTNAQLLGSVQISPAVRPETPIKPQPLLYTEIAAVVGLGLALSLIIIFEWIDDHLAGPEEVQKLLGVETFTSIPKLSLKERNRNIMQVQVLVESYRKLCSSLNTAQSLKPFKLMMITSALPCEGKSSIASNLAIFLALTGKKVLLVDADLRDPVLDQHFHLDNSFGLTDILLTMQLCLKVDTDGQATDIPTLRVITAGTLSPNPAELLQSTAASQLFDRLQKSLFDYVIFDTSALLPVADAQIVASHVQATVLVIDASKTPRKALLQVNELLKRTRFIAEGVVVNKSQWADYRDRRYYMKNKRQPAPALPMIKLPVTPPVNDITQKVMTVISREKQNSNERS